MWTQSRSAISNMGARKPRQISKNDFFRPSKFSSGRGSINDQCQEEGAGHIRVSIPTTTAVLALVPDSRSFQVHAVSNCDQQCHQPREERCAERRERK